MSEPVDRQSAAEQAAELVWREEMALAERRGAARVRQRVRGIPPERRRLLREGNRVVELVELEAVEEAFDAE
ncbi:MAG: hypothetical protein AVDCRST_MAG34-2481 [uncultured Nocardioidaceae bacterium]|uniref:Uncharacterized protein n=1 Tax=uncultured Nocardioidaceae bacterium TaxID=253824 RepID=A0A6J4MPW4_9ACTN|nr:MAG: hypothetical protein AVDCRST_MAG34-2481 [uncultured Nocardioidaceae bacterium]